MDIIKRFFECLIPVTACNLKCEYCYIIQRNNRKMQMPQMKYTSEDIGKALTQNRLGGTCYFSICGAGETLLPKETLEISRHLLENGHYVNITTNGTITKQFDEIVNFPEKYRRRMHISFSLHYIELKRLNLIDVFINNVLRTKNAGISILIQFNMYDGYIPYLDEIKEFCLKNFDALPQIAATRKENDLDSNIQLMTELEQNEYQKLGKDFHSPLFDFTMKNFNKKQKEFCYAGDWSGTLNLSTGILSRCYGSNFRQDIFKNPDEPIKFQAMGKYCPSLFCMNSSHFLSLGVVPAIDTPTYAQLRNREKAGWYSEPVASFLNQKLVDNNEVYTFRKRTVSYIFAAIDIIKTKLRKIKKKIIG